MNLKQDSKFKFEDFKTHLKFYDFNLKYSDKKREV